MLCKECYSEDTSITPLLNPIECLSSHTQYICGSCGRCICIEHDEQRGLQRWNFPFKSLDIAKLYLRSAEYSAKTTCGIYEIENHKKRISYKIFTNKIELETYLSKNKDKRCISMEPIFISSSYIEYPNTQMRKLTVDEIKTYINKRMKK